MCGTAARDIDLGLVERVIEGAERIRFPASLEAFYQRDTGHERCRHLMVFGALALLCYDLFLFADYRLLNDVFSQALVVRLAIVTPLTIAVLGVFSRDPPVWLREGLATFMMLVAMGTAIFLLVQSKSPLAVYAHYPFVLVIVYANVLQRLPFWYACFSTAALSALYSGGIAQLDPLPTPAFSEALFAMAATGLFTLFANYRLERDDRSVYLTALRDNLRRNQLARANDELRAISSHDPLTGLINRRGLDLYLNAVWSAAAAVGQSIAVLMIDVDHFKRFNDRYGHVAGDATLKAITQAASRQLHRDGNLIARYGGEEFVVVFPGADLSDAVRAAEQIRHGIEVCAVPHESSAPGVVTVSIGVAATVPEVTDLSIDLIKKADAALYKAKRSGRNRVWPPIASADGVNQESATGPARAQAA